MLVDASGTVLAAADAKRVAERENLSKHPVVREALAAKARRGAREASDEKGREVIAAWAPVEVGGAVVISSVTSAEAFRAVADLIRTSVFYSIAIVLGAFILSVAFGYFITRPLGKLRDATEVFGRGEFQAEIEVSSADEIGELAESFRQMGKELLDRERRRRSCSRPRWPRSASSAPASRTR
jgi:HAMP domain-containing protein